MKFEKPTIQKQEEVAEEAQTEVQPEQAIETRVETKEEKERRAELLLDELKNLMEESERKSKGSEPPSTRNARFGLMMSNIREVKQLVKEIGETS